MSQPGQIRLLSAGLHTLTVDGGRPHTRSLGVPVGGAADRFALAIGNALVGNPPDAAALEVTLVGPTLVGDIPLGCVVYGAPFELRTDRRTLIAGTTFTLAVGEVLRVGGTPGGMRGYLCVAGGIDVPAVLGSRSGLAPLAAGATLPCRSGRVAARRVAVERLAGDVLRVVEGPQADWFGPQPLRGRVLRVTPASNRMGLRLEGEPLPAAGREMVSEPVCPGSVQVTRDGQCIVLGVDGQTIGGYPKVAQVIAADLDRLAQLRPGMAISFATVGLDEAERLYHERGVALRRWLARLRA